MKVKEKPMVSRAWIDISPWWKRDGDGKEWSVWRVHEEIKDSRFAVTRHSLTRAKEGRLEHFDGKTLVNLSFVCEWMSGIRPGLDELLKWEENYDD